MGCELVHGKSIVALAKDCEGFIAVKTAADSGTDKSIQREIDILEKLNHPLVVRIREPSSCAGNCEQSVVTEFVENGSLADHMPVGENSDLCRLSSPT
jgi:serine/threonine protein kinase